MKAERGKVDYEESRKRTRDTSQSSGSGNQRRRVFIPYSAVPRAPNAPKSSGYAPRPQAPNNAGGTNYRSATGTPGSGACFTCGQPGHYMKECPHNTSVRGAPPPKKFTNPPVAGRGQKPQNPGGYGQNRPPVFFSTHAGTQLPGAPLAVDGAGGLDGSRRPLAAYKGRRRPGENLHFASPPFFPFSLSRALANPSPAVRHRRRSAPSRAPPTSQGAPPRRPGPPPANSRRRGAPNRPNWTEPELAGHRLSPPFPATSGDAVFTGVLRVSPWFSPCPWPSLSRSLPPPPHGPASPAVGHRRHGRSGDHWWAAQPPTNSPRRAESFAPAPSPYRGLNRPIAAAPESSRSC
nr:uncharacterized protein LOC127340480 [Lolium perenne]